MKFDIVLNTKEFTEKLESVIKRVNDGVASGIRHVSEAWYRQVVILADEKFFISAGGYIAGLQIIEPNLSGSVVTGGLKNNKAYAVYREYGTGEFATKGGKKNAWYVHESMIEGGRERFDQYANGASIQIVDTKSNGRFYRITGTKPDAIFQTAFDSTLDVAIDEVATAIQIALRGV